MRSTGRDSELLLATPRRRPRPRRRGDAALCLCWSARPYNALRPPHAPGSHNGRMADMTSVSRVPTVASGSAGVFLVAHFIKKPADGHIDVIADQFAPLAALAFAPNRRSHLEATIPARI